MQKRKQIMKSDFLSNFELLCFFSLAENIDKVVVRTIVKFNGGKLFIIKLLKLLSLFMVQMKLWEQLGPIANCVNSLN